MDCFPNASGKYLAFTFLANFDNGNFSKNINKRANTTQRMKMLVSELL
jgi:hypothetical protein